MSSKTLLVGTLVLIAIGLNIAVVEAQRPPGGLRSPAAPLGTGFTYQGQLKNNGALVNGSCDFQFGLWDDSNPSIGNQIGVSQTMSSLGVTNGLFATLLNDTGQFGASALNGGKRWLAIAVRCPTGVGSYTALSPRQALTPAPYALALPGLYTQQNGTSPNVIGGHISNTVTANVVGATIGGGGQPFYFNQISANFGAIGGGQNNNIPVTGTFATIGGGVNNTASNYSATIGGGLGNNASGDSAAISGGFGNNASGPNATVGGGAGNTATMPNTTISGGANNTASGYAATISGGFNNAAGSDYATVGGGDSNIANGLYATVGAGKSNIAGGYANTIGGGQNNTVNGFFATIGGGQNNTAINSAATVGGGENNTASGDHATVGGGHNNTASGDYSTVPGGLFNSATMFYTLAAGRRAKAIHEGAFVWGDSTNSDFASTAPNQFLVRASGGVTLYTNSASTIGATLQPGSGTWSLVSDRNLKENFAAVNRRDVLLRLAVVPIQVWNYKTQDASIRHIGPVAQDFYAAFGVGEDEKHITTVDADGVAFAAIQGLYQVVQEKDAEISYLRSQVASQRAEMDDLKTRLAALEKSNSDPSGLQDPKGLTDWNAALALLIGVVGVIAIERARKGGAG